jgi:alcohol dehydrogenase
MDDSRLARAREFGADITINNSSADAVAEVMELTGGLGADVAIEAVGVPATFELCTELIRPGGRVANVGVHGHSVTLHLETLWIRDVTITTGLVDAFTTAKLLKLVADGKLDATPFVTHRFPLSETMSAYDTFGDAAATHALKVVLEAEPVAHKPVLEKELVGSGV